MSEIYVQVNPVPGRAGQLGGAPLVERLADRIGELSGSIGGIATDLWNRLDADLPCRADGTWLLDQLELKFTLGLEAEAGVVVARATAAAGFELTLTWQRTEAS